MKLRKDCGIKRIRICEEEGGAVFSVDCCIFYNVKTNDAIYVHSPIGDSIMIEFGTYKENFVKEEMFFTDEHYTVATAREIIAKFMEETAEDVWAVLTNV